MLTPERTLAWLARVLRLLTTPFVRYRIEGGRCVYRPQVGVVAVNHRSLFDVAAGLIAIHHFRRYPRLLVAREYLQGRWTAPFARAIGAIPVDRHTKDGSSVGPAITALRDGIPVLVMPEGHLYWNPEDPMSTGMPHSGVSRIAVGAGVAILPVGLVGTEEVWPPNARVPRLNPFRRKTVVINLADEPLELDGDDHRANAEIVMREVRRLIASA